MVSQPGTSNSRNPLTIVRLLGKWKKQYFQTRWGFIHVRGTQSQREGREEITRPSPSPVHLFPAVPLVAKPLQKPECTYCHCLREWKPPLSLAYGTDQSKGKKKIDAGICRCMTNWDIERKITKGGARKPRESELQSECTRSQFPIAKTLFLTIVSVTIFQLWWIADLRQLTCRKNTLERKCKNKNRLHEKIFFRMTLSIKMIGIICFILVNHINSYFYFGLSVWGSLMIFFKITLIYSLECFHNEQHCILVLVWKFPTGKNTAMKLTFRRDHSSGDRTYIMHYNILELKGTLKDQI